MRTVNQKKLTLTYKPNMIDHNSTISRSFQSKTVMSKLKSQAKNHKWNQSKLNSVYRLLILTSCVTFVNCWTVHNPNITEEDSQSFEKYSFKKLMSFKTKYESLFDDKKDETMFLNRAPSRYKNLCVPDSPLSCDAKEGNPSKLQCRDNICHCPPEHGYQYESGECRHFANFNCSFNIDCQNSDSNLICSTKNNKCKCRFGFSQNIKTKLCEMTASNQTSNLANLLHLDESSSAKFDQKKQDYFEPHISCSVNSQCQGNYTYCYRGECRCWPEFKFVSARYLNENETDEPRVPDYGFCVRKICTFDFECKRLDNPNLICNNTICECRFGFHLQRDFRVCTRHAVRNRNGCDDTCRVVGGIFAIIFLLTLLYWCCSCIYHIIKSYQHNRVIDELQAGSLSTSAWLGASINSIHPRSSFDDTPPPYESLKADYDAPPKYEAAIEMCDMSHRSQVHQQDNCSQTESDKLLAASTEATD